MISISTTGRLQPYGASPFLLPRAPSRRSSAPPDAERPVSWEQLTKDLAQIDQVWQETLESKTGDQQQLESHTTEKLKLENDVAEVEARAVKAREELADVIKQEQLQQQAA